MKNYNEDISSYITDLLKITSSYSSSFGIHYNLPSNLSSASPHLVSPLSSYLSYIKFILYTYNML